MFLLSFCFLLFFVFIILICISVSGGGKWKGEKRSNLSEIKRYENNRNICEFSAVSTIKQKVGTDISVLNFSNMWDMAERAATLSSPCLCQKEEYSIHRSPATIRVRSYLGLTLHLSVCLSVFLPLSFSNTFCSNYFSG